MHVGPHLANALDSWLQSGRSQTTPFWVCCRSYSLPLTCSCVLDVKRLPFRRSKSVGEHVGILSKSVNQRLLRGTHTHNAFCGGVIKGHLYLCDTEKTLKHKMKINQ
ncbi:hypothetical protein TNCT_673671 [Trichonephila clavata]|uniref:Uncharacterized protein n=1 Tax=Trichonephila clavata TaxID=2740835 RepID=A0A8X6HDZ7_TRICU|nr:hypothetical protein TNCT_673671 [Trichonephila clavata]